MVKKRIAVFCVCWIALSKYALAAPTIGSPSVDPSDIYVGIPALVTVSVRITDPCLIKSSVNLLLLDDNNKTVSILGSLHDDGLGDDLVANDNIYTVQKKFIGEQTGSIKLKISAAFKGLLKRVFSELFFIIVNNSTSPDMSKDIAFNILKSNQKGF